MATTMDETMFKLAQSGVSMEQFLLFKKALENGNTGTVAKAPAPVDSRAPVASRARKPQAKPEDMSKCCKALVWGLEEDAEGKLVPKQCRTKKVEGHDFCKKHYKSVLPEDQFCEECTEHKRKEEQKKNSDVDPESLKVIHTKLWQHKGTVDEPGWQYVTFRSALESLYRNAQNKYHQPSDDEPAPKRGRGRASKKGDGEHKKRTKNPFMLFSDKHRDDVRIKLKAEAGGDDAKIRASEVAKVLGTMWGEASDKEKKHFVEEAKRLKEEAGGTVDSAPAQTPDTVVDTDVPPTFVQEEDAPPSLDAEAPADVETTVPKQKTPAPRKVTPVVEESKKEDDVPAELDAATGGEKTYEKVEVMNDKGEKVTLYKDEEDMYYNIPNPKEEDTPVAMINRRGKIVWT